MAATASATTDVSKGRRSWFTVLTIIFGLAAGLLLFGLVSLVLGWFVTGKDQVHRVHYAAGTGVPFGLMMSIPFLLQARRPEAKLAASQEIGAMLIALLAAIVVAQDWELLPFFVAIVVAFGVTVALHPARHRLASLEPEPGRKGNAILYVLAVAAAAPLAVFALDMAKFQREGLPTDPHVEMHHWTGMAAMAFGIVLVALLGALRTPGWRIPAWTAGLGAIVFGLASVVYPKYPGSAGTGWGWIAIAGGVVYLAVSEWEARRAATPAAPPSAAAPGPG